MQQTTDLIGSAEAAGILYCSQRTVHRLVDAGRLPIFTTAPGGRKGVYLFDRAEVERLSGEFVRDAS